MLVGYARTSTFEQEHSLEHQKTELAQLGCEKIFAEHAGATGKRPEFQSAIDFCREGDKLCVQRLDRFARSVVDMYKNIEILQNKGVELKICNLALDTETATGKMMLSILGSVAEFERSLMLERQREGIAKAKKLGRYKGRAPTARAKQNEIQRLTAEGLKPKAIAKALMISVPSVYALRKGWRENFEAVYEIDITEGLEKTVEAELEKLAQI